MPLAGTICCQTGQPRSFAECTKDCRQGLCKHSLPILVNMQKQAARREGVGLSATTLSACPRAVILQQREEYYEDPEDYYARWMGTVGHYAIEMDGPYPGVVQEVRFYRTIQVDGYDVEISGQPDWIEVDLGLIADHKFSGSGPKDARKEHVWQLNIYRWLVEGGYVKGTEHQFLDVTRDGSGEDWEISGYQAHPGEKHNPIPKDFSVKEIEIHYYHQPTKEKKRHTEFHIPIWSDNDVERYIRSAVYPHVYYLKTGKEENVGSSDAWRYNYCPFRHACNPGTCCLAPVSETLR